MAFSWLLLSIGVLSCSLQANAQAVAADTCTCTEEYSPICAAGTLYSNPCMAQCKGFGPDATYKPVDGVCKKPCNACDLEYSPVCAHGKMYTSVCHAACNGIPVNVTYAPDQGSCEFVPVPGCVAPVPTDLTPKVCAISSDRQVFQFNSQGAPSSSTCDGKGCEATCLGITKTFPCGDMTKCSACMPYELEVCAKKDVAALVGTTLPNPCLATCAGYTELKPGACPCGCSKEYAPVCAVTAPEGKMDQYPNACMAQCAGVLQWKDGACSVVPEVCACPLNYAPVCGTSAVGTKATFPNTCSALCATSVETTPGVCPADKGAAPK